MNRLIGQVAGSPLAPSATAPTLDPTYAKKTEAGESIGLDAATLHARGLVGLATSKAHWDEPAAAVHLDPPPPDMLPFVLEPSESVPAQKDLAIARYLRHRRLVVVGGIPSAALVETLRVRFAIVDNQVEWIGSEKNQRVNLDLLDGLRAERDLVFCIAGHVGHDTREAAQQKCRKLGVEFRYAQTPNMIVQLLLADFGSRAT